MGLTTVSILVPAYNVSVFIPQCLDSILEQTYDDLQVVVIDDGSNDSTLDVCQKYADKDLRIEIFHQDNQGVAATRNNLLDKAKGDYVLFVDADDWVELNMVEYLVRLAKQYDAGMVMCDKVINDTKPSSKEPNTKILSQEEAVRDFLRHEYFVGSLWNKLFDRNLLHNEQFHREISYGEDALFCWGVLQKVDKVVASDKQLYHYRMNEDSLSHGGFGPKKFSAHQVWKSISQETRKNWSRFQPMADARWALEDAYLLRNAVHSKYPRGKDIEQLQNTVKHHFKDMLKSDFVPLKWLAYAFWISRCYRCI